MNAQFSLLHGTAISGLTIDRLDRAIVRHKASGFVLKGGKGKGGTYRLTNTGAARAEDMARILFEQLV